MIRLTHEWWKVEVMGVVACAKRSTAAHRERSHDQNFYEPVIATDQYAPAKSGELIT